MPAVIKMLRQIIKIDEEKCNGCGLCVSACHEGAIAMINGKAKLLRDDYCDGLGNCLPVCPTGAITFEQRDTLEFNEEAVKANMEENMKKVKPEKLACGCPGTHSKTIHRIENEKVECIAQQYKDEIVVIERGLFGLREVFEFAQQMDIEKSGNKGKNGGNDQEDQALFFQLFLQNVEPDDHHSHQVGKNNA